MGWLQKLLGLARPARPAQVSTVRKSPSGVYVIRVCGVLSKATLDNIQKLAAREIDQGTKGLRILLLLSDFRGWKKGDDWGDVEFLAQYGQDIAKIAVVADPAVKEQIMLFLLAGQRPAEVRFFALGQEEAARGWLA